MLDKLCAKEAGDEIGSAKADGNDADESSGGVEAVDELEDDDEVEDYDGVGDDDLVQPSGETGVVLIVGGLKIYMRPTYLVTTFCST